MSEPLGHTTRHAKVLRALAVATAILLVATACTANQGVQNSTTPADATSTGAPPAEEIAHWVNPALDGGHSFAYAGYWYNGHVYAANTALSELDDPATHRGFDVLAVDRALLGKTIHLPHMNAQTQEPLERSGG